MFPIEGCVAAGNVVDLLLSFHRDTQQIVAINKS